MEYATCERVWWFGPQNHLWMIFGFGPQNLGEGSEEERGSTWRNHRGCVEVKQEAGLSDRLKSGWPIMPLG